MVDDKEAGLIFHMENLIPIAPWDGKNKKDPTLENLTEYLLEFVDIPDVRDKI